MPNLFEKWSSVKNFSDKEVELEKLKEIFEDTTKAPTAFNLQPYYFKVLDSEKAKERAVDSAILENRWIEDADKIVLLVGDERIDTNLDKSVQDQIERGLIDEEAGDSLKQRIQSYIDKSNGFKRRWLTRNAMIPATFFMLSCVDKGLGCCPVKGFNEDKLSEFLELKHYERPQLMIPIGYPEENERGWRRDPEEIYEIL